MTSNNFDNDCSSQNSNVWFRVDIIFTLISSTLWKTQSLTTITLWGTYNFVF